MTDAPAWLYVLYVFATYWFGYWLGRRHGVRAGRRINLAEIDDIRASLDQTKAEADAGFERLERHARELREELTRHAPDCQIRTTGDRCTCGKGVLLY